MPASQLSSAVRAIEERGGGAYCSHSLTSSHLLLGGKVFVYMSMVVSGGWKKGHTIVLPLALTHFGLSCILNPSNAKLSVVPFGGTLLKSVTVPHPSVSGDKGV